MAYLQLHWGYVLAALCGFLLWRRHGSRRGLPLPPGPRRLPIIGNLLDMPAKGGKYVFKEMNAKYGMTAST